MELRKIVLTGGPCGGKTTALTRIQEYFSELGWRVLIVSETATDFFSSGFTPQDFKREDGDSAWIALEGNIMLTQVNKEHTIATLAGALGKTTDKVLMVCDRGLLDNQAYMDEGQFKRLLDQMPECNGHASTYEAVFHLVTAADGAEEYYVKKGKDGKEVRDEDLKDARELDLKLQRAWSWHPYYRITRNEKNVTFKMKIDNVITQIAEFLGVPVPYNIQRKYLIRYPDVAMLESMANCQKLQVVQTFLPTSENGEEVRVRMISSGPWKLFTRITKLKTEVAGTRIETKRNISENDYLNAVQNGVSFMRKTRYSILLHEGSYPLKVDIFPDNDEYAILEVVTPETDSTVSIPGYLTTMHEVTGDARFYNATIAMNNGKLPSLSEALFK